MFTRGDKVVATRDLPGVPAGTAGVVTMVVGFEWVRCRVRFESGEELGGLDEKSLDAAGRYGALDRPVARLPWWRARRGAAQV
jgi:hypothetical protein